MGATANASQPILACVSADSSQSLNVIIPPLKFRQRTSKEEAYNQAKLELQGKNSISVFLFTLLYLF